MTTPCISTVPQWNYLCFTSSKVHAMSFLDNRDRVALQLYASIGLSDLMHLMVLSSKLSMYMASVRNASWSTMILLASQLAPFSLKRKGVYMVTMCTMMMRSTISGLIFWIFGTACMSSLSDSTCIYCCVVFAVYHDILCNPCKQFAVCKVTRSFP